MPDMYSRQANRSSRSPSLRFAKDIIEGKLWELKITRHRIFYVLIVGPVMVLLHAYKKQGQKAPPRELEVARKRMKGVLGE